jgi:hypothetical protein
MEAVVEFHGFKDNDNRFVVKELAIVGKYLTTHLMFSAPYSSYFLNAKMYKTARWLTNNFHFLNWDDEGVPYDEGLIRVLCSQFSVLYTKGYEKVQFLKQFHGNVQGIEESCKPFLGFQMDFPCIVPQHNGCSGNCAMRSARWFYNSLNLGKL